MWFQIFKFELRYRRKRPATYIYFAILFLISFLAISTDIVQIGGGTGLVKENAPVTIATMMVIISAVFMMITSAIMGVGILRDFEHKTESLLFVNPISKFDYLFGRFLGSFVVLLFVFTGALLGFIIGEFMPWRDADKLLPFNLWNYLHPFIYYVIPNLLITSVLFFITGAISRKMMIVYIQWILLFAFYQLTLIITAEVENRDLAAILDPFAITTINNATQYWTVTEQNTNVVSIEGVILYNRLLWLGISLLMMIGGYFAFSFNVVRNSLFKKKTVIEVDDTKSDIVIPKAKLTFGLGTHLRQIVSQSVFYFKQVLKSVPFRAIVICGISLLIGNSSFMGRTFGVSTYPTTYLVLELIDDFNIFFFIILVFYSGELIWKERDAKINLIHDAMPIPDFVGLISKFIGLVLVYCLLLLVLILAGITIQTFKGYYNYELGVYFGTLFSDTLLFLILFTLLSFFIQVMVNNKFIGYATIVVFFILTFALQLWGVEHGLFIFGDTDLGPYSDMNGFGHFLKGFSWFNIYWLGFSVFLFVIAVMFASRGSESTMKIRWKTGKLRLNRPLQFLGVGMFCVFLLSGCYIYYNTNVLNVYYTSDTFEKARADYEKTLKKYQYLNQPAISDVNLKVEIYPSDRDYEAEGYYLLENYENEPIREVHIQLNPDEQFSYEYIKFDRESIVKENVEELKYIIYELKEPLLKEQKLKMSFKTIFETKGFVENRGNTDVVYNGTFFNNGDFPSIGYNEGFELVSDNDRKDYDLKPKERALERDDPKGLTTGGLGDSRGINFEIVLGTESDQIAIAPGYLQKEWTENERKYYHYKMDVPIENFYNIISAKYEVMEDKMTIVDDSIEKDINLEIYYHKGHEYNLNRMMKGMKKSLSYFSEAFSPYQYRQMRILEFPRYASFAQSFANTVPFSEGIGFMLEIKEEADVDIAYYVTAHEMAHQWWGHQVNPANVKGGTMIVESLAQYSALMVMQNEYSLENMQEFLKEEMNRYLSGRANEQKKELPLVEVENQQYIHYGKGAVSMYALQDYISEDSVNVALKRFCNDWRSFETNKRYATTKDLIGYFREVTPDSLQPVITDLFEKIVLFENKTDEASYEKSANGKYLIDIAVSAKKFEADSLGLSKEIAVKDWIDIGVYGKDEKGKDKLLYLKKHKISKPKMNFRIEVDALPEKVGIDPINKLIDRNPEDNIIRISEKSTS
ncbi:aminopeptidase [Flavobacteriaceae bacterium R38]|nr:aminopeptidase [Flavobacteriaceae bacterium R38]